MRHIYRYSWILLWALALSACDDGGTTTAPVMDAAVIPAECESDRRRCTDDGVELCVEGQWRTVGACADGTSCEDGACVPTACEPDCNGRICGSDGCGAVCGDCEAGWICNLEGRCDAPPARCGDAVCNGDETCGTCPADCGNCCGDDTCAADDGETCTTCPADCGCAGTDSCNAQTEACEACVPQCNGRECGDNGCGATCGDCANGVTCDNGVCDVACMPQCDGRACGADGCGATCGDCANGEICGAGGQCDAPPARCGDQVCGDGEDCANCPVDCGVCCGDGQCSGAVGENCATCPADCGCGNGELCNVEQRRCIAECVPQCDGRNCGDDGCGGVCGNCVANQACEAGVCRDLCQAACADNECGGDGCGGSCGDCANGTQCDNGQCAQICSPACDGRQCGPDGCGGFCGGCELGELCTEAGQCDAVCARACDGRQCGDDGCGGVCGECRLGEACNADDGQCVEQCVPQCDDRACGGDGCGGICGECPEGAVCAEGGVCLGGGDFCDCADHEVCLEGICRLPEQICSDDTPNGLCPNGRACIAGACIADGSACTPANPTGTCGLGDVCRDGACVAFDGAALCDDHNDCTRDWYDHQRNQCVNAPIEAQCDDGNACTNDVCAAGICEGTPIGGCIEPPRVDPVASPTNDGNLRLRGDKPAGASILIDGAEAVPESPNEEWSLVLQLQPGENVFEIRSNDHGQQSEAVTIRVIYDNVPPTVQITPAGGIFLDAVTVQVTSDEPATIYYTDDGSEPDQFSKSFRSVKRIRVFSDTTLRFLVADVAGNWQDEIPEATFEITGRRNRWHEGAPLPEGLILAASAQLNDVLYVIGGSDGLATQAGVSRFDLRAEDPGAWEAAPALDTGRAQAAAVTVSNAIYVFGGEDDGTPLNRVQRLDGDAWVDRAPMPSTRYGLAAAVVGNNVYVFGGKTNGGVVLTNNERYTPGNNTWTNQVAQMPRPRYGHQAIALDNMIYLIGGEDEDGVPVAEVDVYTPSTNQWSQIAPLPTPRSFATASLNLNRGIINEGMTGIVIAGGRLVNGSATAVVEEYVFTDDVWRTRTPLQAPRHSATGIGGVWNSGLDATRHRGFVIGGQRAGDISADVRWYTHDHDYINAQVPVPEGRFSHGAVEFNGKFYIFGGRNFQATDLFWAYDPETGRTEMLPALPSVQNALGAVAHDGRIYALGGGNQFNNAVAHARAYDLALKRWIDLTPMPTARTETTAAYHRGEIWVIGGTNNGALQAVEVYNPETDSWRVGPVLPEGRSGARVIAHDTELVVVGGVRPNGDLHTDVLVLRGNAWSVLTTLPAMSHVQLAAIHSHRAVIFGGRTPVGPQSTVVSFDLRTGARARTLTDASNRLDRLDRAAVVNHHDTIWIIGGNATNDIGPEGVSTVRALDAHCFNGIADGREHPVGVVNTDAGGGCPLPIPLADGDARIGGGNAALGQEGLLEVYHNGRWGIVCDDNFDQREVQVVCGEIFGVQNGSFRNRDSNRRDFWLDDLGCGGAERRLSECAHPAWGAHNCSDTETVYVTCRQ